MAPLSLLLLLIFSLFTLSLSHSSTDSFIFGGCTQQKYSPDSPYPSTLDSLLTSLLNAATYSPYNHFSAVAGDSTLSALYQCRGDLSMPDCSACVSRSLARLSALCPAACGGAVQLDGCFLKYDNASFVGVEDKTVIFKKCGPSSGAMQQGGVVVGRDAGLASSGGLFRVGGSGNVAGLAQCVGDLGLRECQDCLSEAIRRLRSDCGDAAYGDVFLGKCYVRYSVDGAHDYSKAHGQAHQLFFFPFCYVINILRCLI